MKVSGSQFSVLGWVLLSTLGVHAQEEKKASPPVALPKLEHFAALWERSIVTTKDLPAPETPGGPNFADNLSLSGVYEIDGGVVAVLVDRTTSQVMEARIGSENEMGIKIRQVTPGASLDKTRIQLQKGDQAGWVTFADPAAGAAQPAEVVQKAVIPAPNPAAVSPVSGAVPPQRRAMRPAPAAALPANPLLPPPPAAIPQAPTINDVPLPPP
jgi:hypothetical protein